MPGTTRKKVERAFLPGLRRTKRLAGGGRSIKMIRPACDKCQKYPEWWKDCEHNPYIAVVPRRYEVPEYEDVLDDEGKPTGRKRVTGTTTEIEYESRPNWKEVVVAPALGGWQKQVPKNVQRGCIFTWELETPEYPNGIAEVCQFRGCFQQKQANGEPLIENEYGAYCRPIEAKLAKYEQMDHMTDSGKRLEIGFNPWSLQRRNKQLEGIKI